MKNRSIFYILAILTVFIIAYIGTSEVPVRYSYLISLPLVQGLLYLIEVPLIGNKRSNIATILVSMLTFVRYCVLPMLMVASGYSSVLPLPSYICGNEAILLMVYESFSISIALILSNRKLVGSRMLMTQETTNDKLISLFVLGGLVYCVLVAYFVPNVQEIFRSIFDLADADFNMAIEEEFAAGSMLRALRTLFTIVFNVIRIMLPIYIIRYLISKRVKYVIIYGVIILLVVLQFLLITSTFAEAVVSTLVFLLAIVKIDPKVGKTTMRAAPILVSTIVFVYFYVRYTVQASMYNTSSSIVYMAEVVNAYFTGIDNVAGSMILSRDERFTYLIDSIITTIPFNTTLFGQREVFMQTLFNTINGSQGQIPSTIGNGYFYFGFLLAPIFSFCFTYYSVYFSKRAESVSILWKYVAYTFISVVLSLAIAMYNEIITMSWINAWGLPLMIIAYISKKKQPLYK